MKVLVVIPSDPIAAYEKKGTASWLKDYYNPQSYFDKVYVLSPRESVKQDKYGLTILPITHNSQYKSLIKKIKPLVVRAYGGYWATDFAVLNKVKGIPILASVHDTSLELMHDSLKHVDYIACMSDVIKTLLIEKGLPQTHISVLGNRVNTSKFKRLSNSETSPLRKQYPEGKIILHVGRKSEEKNIENVIEALTFLPQDYILILIGQGDTNDYERLADKLNVVSRIFWIDRIKNEDLPLWYNMSDVFCVPSRREGFGLVFVEAAMCGTKIVTTNIKPMNEFLTNDRIMNFLVEDCENTQEIANCITEAVNSEGQNNNTIDFIKNKFEKSKIEAKEIAIYKQVIDKGSNDTFSMTYIKWRLHFIANKHWKSIRKLFRRVWKRIR